MFESPRAHHLPPVNKRTTRTLSEFHSKPILLCPCCVRIVVRIYTISIGPGEVVHRRSWTGRRRLGPVSRLSPFGQKNTICCPGWALSFNGSGWIDETTGGNRMSQEQLAAERQAPLLQGYLTKGEFARQINRSPRTLERWATARTGPPRIVIGRLVLYRTESVREWLAKQERGIKRGRTRVC